MGLTSYNQVMTTGPHMLEVEGPGRISSHLKMKLQGFKV